jgi:hypothetical protein
MGTYRDHSRGPENSRPWLRFVSIPRWQNRTQGFVLENRTNINEGLLGPLPFGWLSVEDRVPLFCGTVRLPNVALCTLTLTPRFNAANHQ